MIIRVLLGWITFALCVAWVLSWAWAAPVGIQGGLLLAAGVAGIAFTNAPESEISSPTKSSGSPKSL